MRKGEQAILNATIKERKDLEQERREERARKAQQTATQILRNAKKEELQRVERENKKREAYNSKLEEAFERDKKNREMAAAKGDDAAAKERENEKFITQAIYEAEVKIVNKVTSKEAQLKMRQDKAAERAEHIRMVAEQKKEEKKLKEEERIVNYMKKIDKVQKTRVEATKALKLNITLNDKPNHKERLAEIKKMQED